MKAIQCIECKNLGCKIQVQHQTLNLSCIDSYYCKLKYLLVDAFSLRTCDSFKTIYDLNKVKKIMKENRKLTMDEAIKISLQKEN